MSEYDYLFKVLVLGSQENQKDFILGSVKHFGDHHRYVIGVDFGITNVLVDDRRIKLQIWNPATQERFSYIRPLYYRGASHILLITDQGHYLELAPFIQELLSNCGQIPVHFVIRCSSQFAKTLKDQSEQLRNRGLTSPITVIKQPQDLYPLVGQTLLYHRHDLNWAVQLTLLLDDDFPWRFINSEQDDTAAIFFNFLEDQLTAIRNWNIHSLGFNYDGSQMDETALMRQLELYYEIIESMGGEIDEDHLLAIVENEIGRFKISLRNGSVIFIPKNCFDCKNPCFSHGQSLCIVQRSAGWSSEALSKKQLLILSKIYAVKHGVLPKHVWNQMKGHRCYSKKKCTNPVARRTAQALPNNVPAPTLTHLRDDMLRELERLKRIMMGE
ncbi:MAG: hypothetical protein HWN65_23515 [Candidatus Helarchaeota archaeon]|nr:hypothetical protein [Candidatus Helarchaeota archaeon]